MPNYIYKGNTVRMMNKWLEALIERENELNKSGDTMFKNVAKRTYSIDKNNKNLKKK